MTKLLTVLAAFCLFLTAFDRPALAQDGENARLAAHMAFLLEGSGQWRSPNPDYEEGNEFRPVQYGVNWRWADDGQHLIGEVTGIYESGRVARYHTMYAFLNPVTDRVVTQQVSWDGTFTAGEQVLRTDPMQAGDVVNVDMIEYAADGQAKITRHRGEFIDARTHRMDVYERDETGEWSLVREWVWRLADTE